MRPWREPDPRENDPRWPFLEGVFGEVVLEVKGREPPLWVFALQGCLPLLLLLGACGALGAAPALAIPNTPWNTGAVTTSIAALTCGALFAGSRWSRWQRRRRGPVFITTEGVTNNGLNLIRWSRLTGYRTNSRDQLVELSVGDSGELVVPTLTRAERERVIALLSERSIPQLD